MEAWRIGSPQRGERFGCGMGLPGVQVLQQQGPEGYRDVRKKVEGHDFGEARDTGRQDWRHHGLPELPPGRWRAPQEQRRQVIV